MPIGFVLVGHKNNFNNNYRITIAQYDHNLKRNWPHTGSVFNKTLRKLKVISLDVKTDRKSLIRTDYAASSRQTVLVCLFVCLGFNGTFSTNRLYRAITVG